MIIYDKCIFQIKEYDDRELINGLNNMEVVDVFEKSSFGRIVGMWGVDFDQSWFKKDRK